jgi:hypothetical protein
MADAVPGRFAITALLGATSVILMGAVVCAPRPATSATLGAGTDLGGQSTVGSAIISQTDALMRASLPGFGKPWTLVSACKCGRVKPGHDAQDGSRPSTIAEMRSAQR